ncbi:hypothetical protein J6590_047397 [Homalodisca vitripennis]|nr:hypothetical protein J6590_047397 [Homalodisca vitripennis]
MKKEESRVSTYGESAPGRMCEEVKCRMRYMWYSIVIGSRQSVSSHSLPSLSRGLPARSGPCHRHRPLHVVPPRLSRRSVMEIICSVGVLIPEFQTINVFTPPLHLLRFLHLSCGRAMIWDGDIFSVTHRTNI